MTNKRLFNHLNMKFSNYEKTEGEYLYNSFKPLDSLPEWAIKEEFGEVPSNITVYHYGKELTGKPIHVTDDQYYAEEFKESGDKLFIFNNVPISELRVMGEGRISTKNRHTGTEGREFLYIPKK